MFPPREGKRPGVEQLLAELRNPFAQRVLERNRDLFGDDPDKLQAITRLAEKINKEKPDQKLGFRYLNDFLSCLRQILEIRGEGASLSVQEINMFSQFFGSKMTPDSSQVGYSLDTEALDAFIQRLADPEMGRFTNTTPMAEVPPEPPEDTQITEEPQEANPVVEDTPADTTPIAEVPPKPPEDTQITEEPQEANPVVEDTPTDTTPIAEVPPQTPKIGTPELLSLGEATEQLNPQRSETPKTEQPTSPPTKKPEPPSEHERRMALLRSIRKDLGRNRPK